jgi:hypothetical protein
MLSASRADERPPDASVATGRRAGAPVHTHSGQACLATQRNLPEERLQRRLHCSASRTATVQP